jgi:hypothetical protein
MKKLGVICHFLLFYFLMSTAYAFDCSGVKPFTPIAYKDVSIYVGHFYWKKTSIGSAEEVVEEVCSTDKPLQVPVLDIRGREEEWFYCYDYQPTITCSTTYQGTTAEIQVKPAIAIRSWMKDAALDSHFHAFIIPNGDKSKIFDLFARNITPNLSAKNITIDAAGGGRGENSSVDSFYVRTDFE